MKKLILASMTLLWLAACNDSDTATPEMPNSNVAGDTNIENVSTTPTPSPAPTAEPEANTTELLTMIDAMESWSSYHSVSSLSEAYEGEDYPDSEFHVDKQYVANPAQVYMFSSIMGFGNSTIEQYASYEYADGGFESMDDGEFYDMDPETVDIILKDSQPARVALLHAVLEGATNFTENDGAFLMDLDPSSLASLFESMQASFLYNATLSELSEEEHATLTIGTETFHSGEATIVTEGSEILSYTLYFDRTSEISGRTEATFAESFSLVNQIDEIEAPEELMMGIGVN